MSEDRARSLLYSAVTAVKSGENNLARIYLDRVFMNARNHDILADAWFYLSEIEEDKDAKRKALEEALSYRMTHARARRALAILDGKIRAEDVVNADALPKPSGDEKVDAERFACPNCGGRMSFSPSGDALVCEYCTSGGAIGTNNAPTEEQDFFAAMATLRGHSKPTMRKVFHCEGCGAEFLLPPNDISENCAYCASPHVVSHSETRELMDPDAIIPHAFTHRRAAEILVAWVKEHEFRPQGKVLPPRGFYVPVWTFDLAGTIIYSGIRYEKQQRGFQDEMVSVTVRGEHPIFVDDLIVPAAHAHKKDILKLTQSYELREAKPYDARYLSSWAAEAYEIALGDASLEARSRAYKEEKRKVKQLYRQLNNLSTSSANMAVDSYKLLMLPIWMTTYPYEGENYLVLINGQNGTVQGALPNGIKPANDKGGLMGWLGGLLDG